MPMTTPKPLPISTCAHVWSLFHTRDQGTGRPVSTCDYLHVFPLLGRGWHFVFVRNDHAHHAMTYMSCGILRSSVSSVQKMILSAYTTVKNGGSTQQIQA